MKRFDCTFFVLQSDASGGELKELEEKISIASGDYNKARTDYDGMRRQYDEAEERLEGLARQEEEIRLRTVSLNETVREKSAEKSVLEEQIRSIGVSIEETKETLKKISDKLPEKDKQSDSLKEEKNKLAKSVEEFNQKQLALEEERQKAKQESERLEKEGDEGSESILEAVRKQSETSALIDKLNFRIQNINASIASEEEQEDALTKLKEELALITKNAQEEFDKATRLVNESLAIGTARRRPKKRSRKRSG